MPEVEIALRFRAVDGDILRGLLDYLDEQKEKGDVYAVSIHVRYVEG